MNFLNRNSLLSHFLGGHQTPQSQATYSKSAIAIASRTFPMAFSTGPGPSGSTPTPEAKNPSILEAPKMQPTALDKIFLRWSGQVKKGEAVPSIMHGDAIMRARSFARIRINIGFLFLGAVCSYLMIRSGRAAVIRGDSVEKQNLEWHRQVKEDYEKEKAKK